MPSSDESAAQQNLAATHYAHRNDPQVVIDRLKASLPQMHKGGVVKETGPVLLKKGETVTPAPEDQAAPDPQATAQAQDAPNGQDDSTSDEAVAKTVNLKSAYSKLQEALVKLDDESGVRRSFTVPYVIGEMASHINAVGEAAKSSGGLTGNLILSAHHSGGKGYGSDEGHTVGFGAEKCRQTIIPKNDANAKAAIGAAKSYINKIAFLIGKEDPSVLTAQSQLKLIGHADMSGMTLADAIIALVNLVHPPAQAFARSHQLFKHGQHHPTLTGPVQEEPQA